MGKTLYLNCANGISGDMLVGALLALGADKAALLEMIQGLKLEGLHCHIKELKSYSILATDFDVHTHEHGTSEHHHHEEHHDHKDHHDHEDHHHEGHHHHEDHHHHEHRHLSNVLKIIDDAPLSENAKTIARKIFQIVANAEAKVHGCALEEVHFHEVGALDSIADILSIAFCIDNLGITEVATSTLSEGHGTVHCMHGEIAVPVPAVTEIAATYNIPLTITDNHGEMVTPTGIAAVAALKNTQLPSSFIIQKQGFGSGKKDFGRPNVLQAMLISAKEDSNTYLIETNIDDMSGEALSFATEKLLEAGALDVFTVPCYMKKGRPAWILSVIASSDLLSKMEELIFLHTTSIGLRKRSLERSCMDRELKSVKTSYGEITVKVCHWGNITKQYPEFESVKEVAEKNNLDFATLYNTAQKASV